MNEREYWEAAARRALSPEGDVEAARELLSAYVWHIQNLADQTDYYYVHARFIADAIERLLAGDEKIPARAFGLKRNKPGRPRGQETWDHSALSAAVALLMRRGFGKTAAVTALSEHLGPDESTIFDAEEEFPDYRTNPEFFTDDTLMALIAPYRSAVAKILESTRKNRSNSHQ
jgi:hypothetical protein